jgi:fibronectin-binding autotransporter adhesin
MSVGLRRLCLGLVACSIVLVGARPAAAQTFYWNPNGVGVGGGSGTWDTSSLFWNDQPTWTGNQTAWVNSASNNATFNSPTTDTVTLSAAITAGSVSVTAGNVTFSNAGNFTLTASSFGVSSGATASIDGTNFFKSGTTALNVDGSLTVNAGPASGRLVTLTGGGTLIANGGIRINGNTAAMVFSGNLVDFNTGAGQRLAINMNGSAAGTVLRLSGDNSGATGDFLLSSGVNNNVIRLESANALSSSTVLRIEGGTNNVVELAFGNLTRTTGNTAGSGAGGLNLTGSGGFAALGADRSVTLVGGGQIVWTTQGFNPSATGFQMSDANATNTLTLTNDINLNGPATGTAPTRAFFIGHGSAAVDAVIPGVISDTGVVQATLAINGSNGARVLITGNNTFGGAITIGTATGGPAVQISNPNQLGVGTATISILGNNSTGSLELVGGISIGRSISLSGRPNTNLTPGIVNVSGNNTLAGIVTGNTGGSFYIFQSNSGTLTIQNGFLTQASGIRGVNLGGAGNGVLNGTLTGPNTSTPTFQLTKYGTGTWTLGGTVTLTGGAGVPGETTPTGNTVIVQGGTLLVNSSFTAGASTAAAVRNTATLGGSGNLGGTVSVDAGGTVAPGTPAALGTLVTGSGATFSAGSTLRARLGPNGPSGTSDSLLLTSGTLNFLTSGTSPTNPTLALAALGFTGTAGGAAHYTLVDTGGGTVQVNGATPAGPILGEFVVGTGNVNGRPVLIDTSGLSNLSTGETFVLQVNGSLLELNYSLTPVPEPSWILAVAGAAGLGFYRRRARRQES